MLSKVYFCPRKSTFNLLHGRQFLFPMVVERCGRLTLELLRVLSHTTGRRVAALAHARMVPQPALVQIGMCQRVHHRYPFILQRNHTLKPVNWQKSSKYVRDRTQASDTVNAPPRGWPANSACKGRTDWAVWALASACGSVRLRMRTSCLPWSACPAVRWSVPVAGRGFGPENRTWIKPFHISNGYASYLEEYPTTQQLAEYAADRPDVDGGCVVFSPHQDLGCPVILRHYLLGHVFAHVWLFHACQTKITDLK